MANHPNRSTWHATVPEPSPDEIRALRGDRLQEEMAQIAGLSSRVRWTEYEAGTRRPHWALWELLLLRLDQHPTLLLVKR